jgi:hypothetical protein
LADAVDGARTRLLAALERSTSTVATAEADRAAGDLAELLDRQAVAVRVTREASVYRPDRPEVSWALDLVDAHRKEPDALERIARHNAEVSWVRRAERRDVTSDTLNGLIAPWHAIEAVRATTDYDRTLTDLWFAGALPPTGMDVVVPRFSTAATAGSAAENALPAESDPATTAGSLPVVTVSAIVDVSSALRWRGGPALDVLVATELAGALDAEVERQVIAGSGTNELTGVLNMSGTTTATYTDGSPTPAETMAKVGALATTIAATTRRRPTHCVAAPRRIEFVFAPQAASTDGPAPFPIADARPDDPPTTAARVAGRAWCSSGGVPLNLGASTNEDRVIVTEPSAAALFLDRPQVFVTERDVPTGYRLAVSRYAVLLPRRPAAIGIVSGTGLAGVLS